MLDRRFTILFAAFLTSALGTWIFRLSIPILLYQLTGSPIALSLAYAAIFLPIFVVMPIGGVLADYYSRKRILLLGDGLSCLIVIGLAIMSAFIAAETSWLLYPILFLLAVATSIYYPCFQAVIPMVVSRDQLPRANALMFSAESIMSAAGPLAGGLFLAALGPTGAILINAGTFAISFVFILLLRIETRAIMRERLSVRLAAKTLRAGFDEAMSNPVIRYGTIVFVFANFASHLVSGNLIYYLSNDAGFGSLEVGLTMGLAAIGSVLGAAIAPTLIRRCPNGPLMLMALTCGSVAILTLLLARGMFEIVLSRGVTMAAEAVIVITMFTLRQRTVPPDFLGRTVAITRAISFAPIPVAAAMGGELIQRTGTFAPVVVLSFVVMLGVSLYGWMSPLAGSEKQLAQL